MSEEENTTEMEAESEQTVGVQLEPADDLMYDQLVEEFGEDLIDADVREVVKERVRALYDSRDEVAQQLQQAQRQAALSGQGQ